MPRWLRGWRLGVGVTGLLLVAALGVAVTFVVDGLRQRDSVLRSLREAAVVALPSGSRLVGSGTHRPDQAWARGTVNAPPDSPLVVGYTPGGADRWTLIGAYGAGLRIFISGGGNRLLDVQVSRCTAGTCPAGGSRIDVAIRPAPRHDRP